MGYRFTSMDETLALMAYHQKIIALLKDEMGRIRP
jgi:hypothetical protein